VVQAPTSSVYSQGVLKLAAANRVGIEAIRARENGPMPAKRIRAPSIIPNASHSNGRVGSIPMQKLPGLPIVRVSLPSSRVKDPDSMLVDCAKPSTDGL
jgi:hypothetical protein